jgi:hypothetical protein
MKVRWQVNADVIFEEHLASGDRSFFAAFSS